MFMWILPPFLRYFKSKIHRVFCASKKLYLHDTPIMSDEEASDCKVDYRRLFFEIIIIAR